MHSIFPHYNRNLFKVYSVIIREYFTKRGLASNSHRTMMRFKIILLLLYHTFRSSDHYFYSPKFRHSSFVEYILINTLIVRPNIRYYNIIAKVAYSILYRTRLEMYNIILLLLFIIHRFCVFVLLTNNGLDAILSYLAVLLRLRSFVCTKNKLYKNLSRLYEVLTLYNVCRYECMI